MEMYERALPGTVGKVVEHESYPCSIQFYIQM